MSASTLPQLLASLRQSVALVSEATPKLSTLAPPEDGLSLLDVKNELLLSYLEHMVFLIVLKLRNTSATSKMDAKDASADLSLENSDLGQSVVKKLVELRLYLEKGVRPLEDKLRYQVEKALRAAEDVERVARQKDDAAAAAAADEDDSDVSGSDDDEEGAAGFGDEKETSTTRPNRGAFVRPSFSAAAASVKSKSSDAGEAAAGGVYRPPKIAPTMMPETKSGRRERAARRPMKSATMDEFIADELSTAPMAELSVGANIAAHGRRTTTAAERKRNDERREYEERNFVRLPKESGKDKSKRNKAEGRSSQMSFGGEEWRGLGEGVDRINRLTQRKSGGGGGISGGGARSMLDKSRKRGIDTVDGPRGSGINDDNAVGGRFNKKLRHHQMGSHRDRNKK